MTRIILLVCTKADLASSTAQPCRPLLRVKSISNALSLDTVLTACVLELGSETKTCDMHSQRSSVQVVGNQYIGVLRVLVFFIVVVPLHLIAVLDGCHADDWAPPARCIRSQQSNETLVDWQVDGEIVVLDPESVVELASEFTVAVEVRNDTSLSRNVLAEVVKVVKHVLGGPVVLEPDEAWATLIVREKDDSAVLGRRTVFVLEVHELLAQHLVKLPVAFLTSLRAILHVVATCASMSRRVGARTAKRRVGRCTTGDSHFVELK